MEFRYRRGFALRSLSFELEPGVTGFLGPNGAGKSTVLGLAATALRPTRGRIAIRTTSAADGRRARAAYRRLVGWLPQGPPAMAGATAAEYVAYCGWLRGMSRAAARTAAARSLDRVGLGERADSLLSELSGGMQRRAGIAQAIVTDPAVVILDEPTAGLDPGQRARIRELVAEVGRTTSVLLSTHLAEDVDLVCSHVIAIADGELRFDGGIAALRDRGAAHGTGGAAIEAAYVAVVGDDG